MIANLQALYNSQRRLVALPPCRLLFKCLSVPLACLTFHALGALSVENVWQSDLEWHDQNTLQ